LRVIDAHQHYWRIADQAHAWRGPGQAAIERDFEPADLRDELAAAGVDATVLVQSADGAAENDRLAAYAHSTPTVAGVVAWLPMHEPAAARRELDRLARMPKLVAVRCLVARDPLDWLARPDVRALFGELAERGLAWDVVPVTAVQREAIRRLAAAVPRLRIVVGHLARPPLERDDSGQWASDLRALARCPGVAVKMSVGLDVLTAWKGWDEHELSRCVAYAVGELGPQRLMLASNWPVVLLRRSYVGAWKDLGNALAAAGVAGVDRAAVLGGTATRWYGLADPESVPRR
jgi:L-fucono-1,5-lactonase